MAKGSDHGRNKAHLGNSHYAEIFKGVDHFIITFMEIY